MTSLPPVRRIITGHSSDGKAVFTADDTLEPVDPTKNDRSKPEGHMVGFSLINRTDGIPARVQGPVTEYHGKMISLVEQDSVTCRIVDFPPRAGGSHDDFNVLHRTQSLDYGVVLKGTIECVLDDGVRKTVNEGDVVVQRGTTHGWVNISDQNCRMLFVLVPANPVRVENTGEILPPSGFERLLPK